MSIFFAKKIAFFGKNITFTQSKNVRAVLETFYFCFQVTVNENISFTDNIITGSGFMITYFYKRLTTNLEIGNTPVRVLPNIWRLGRVKDTKYGTNVSNEMLLNATKCQGYSFYRFLVIKGKPAGGWGIKLPPTQTRVNQIKKNSG